MSGRLTTAFAGGAFALYLAVGAAAYAQPVPSGPKVAPERHQHAMAFREHAPDQARRLRAILQLRPNQEPALAAYLDALKPDRDRLVRMEAPGKAATTPERLARMEQRMAERQAAMRTRIEATKRFYAQLDPAQKRAFDELPLMIGGPMDMMGHMMKVMHRMPGAPPMPPVGALEFEPSEVPAPAPGL